MDAQLLAEFEATVALVNEARTRLEEDGVVIKGQRGGARPSPWLGVLRDQQAHLIRVARILTTRNQEVPVPPDEFQKLLD